MTSLEASAVLACSSTSDPPLAASNPLVGGGGAGGAAAAAPAEAEPTVSSSGSGSRDEGPPSIAGLSGSGNTASDDGGPPGSNGGGAAGDGAAGNGAQAPPVPAACTASTSNASGYCWRSVAIGGGGFVSGIVASATTPGLVYARTDVGGAYRWNESDQSWTPLEDWASENETGLLGVESLALDPSAPNRVYMLAGIDYFNNGKTAILSSEDYGQTFSVHEVTGQFRAHGNGAGRQNGERLAVDPSDGSVLFVGTRRDGLFRSTDRGATWMRVTSLDVTTTPNDNGIAFVVFDAAGTAEGATPTLFVGVSRLDAPNLFASRDGGATFAAVAGQPTGLMPQRAVLGSDDSVLLTYANGAGPNGSTREPMDRGAIWRLARESGIWTDITPLRENQNRAFGGLSVDRADPRRIVASTINTYQQQPWGYGDRIFLSTDGGASWVDLIGERRVAMDTNGIPWIENQAMHWVGSIQIDPFNPERAWLTSGNGVFMTNDLDAELSTWSFAARGLEEVVPLDAVSVRGAPLVSSIGDYDGFVH
ncbi:MAG TPA: hypothetical protein VMG12_04355, partial [Polyangiaceae bacterium]|nr:hypothetical protein [Polyangiaceae bacterium]